jgi:predicted Zn-dependent peptidase
MVRSAPASSASWAPSILGKTPEALETAMLAEIERVKTEPIAAWELEKARNNAKRAVVAGLTSSLQRATLLAEYAASYGDANLINERVNRLLKVTADDVQRVAKQYLTPHNRTVVVTVPKAQPRTNGGGR